jgi:hypothetical protein
MAFELDPERQHDWRQMTIIPITPTPGDIIFHHDRAETKIGCWTCNMSFEEGQGVNCPGRPVEDIGT